MIHRPMTAVFTACFAAICLASGCDSGSSGKAPVTHEGTGPQGKTPAGGSNSPLAKKEAAKAKP
jgi:hypothetical protein